MSEKPEDREEREKPCLNCFSWRTIHRYNAKTGKWECLPCKKREREQEQFKKDRERRQELFERDLEQRQEQFNKRLPKNQD